MEEHNQKNFAPILSNLKKEMAKQEIDALLISHDDEFLSFELQDDSQYLAYITGFTGSAGFACIYAHDLNRSVKVKNVKTNEEQLISCPHAVFIDGRYKIQVTEQTDPELFDTFNFSEVSPADWLCSVLESGQSVGVDLNRISYDYYLKLKEQLNFFGIELKELKYNLIDAIWEEKPEHFYSKVEIYPDEFNGCPSLQKRQALSEELNRRDIDATIIPDPESVCWLLNIRGRDRKGLPVINSRAVAYANGALEWYVNLKHLDDEIQATLEDHFGHVDIFNIDTFNDVLERLCNSQAKVYIDPKNANAHILNSLKEGGATVIEGLGLCQIPKACKNPVEIAGERRAHIKDGIAMCRFLAWLDEQTSLESSSDLEAYQRRVADIDEKIMADKAESYRKIEGDFIEPSFDTISALGPNAAMCHYNHLTAKHPRSLGNDAMYLIDSGAHYIEGTTDITRTVMVGPNISEDEKRMYTLVLKCHIALATTIFPKGTTGLQLDAIARRSLWDYGFDYEHGTGHGVGHLLSVHEGPEVISSRQSLIPLDVGMVVSIEPGFYAAGLYGIRLENLVVVEKCSETHLSHMLRFSPLTLVPFDTRLILREMLTNKEREWLNNYHQRVHQVIKNAGTTLSDMEVNFLTKATARI